MTASHILRRLARKLAKPVALYLNDRALRRSEAHFEHFQTMRALLPHYEQHEKLRQVKLIGRRNEIRSW